MGNGKHLRQRSLKRKKKRGGRKRHCVSGPTGTRQKQTFKFKLGSVHNYEIRLNGPGRTQPQRALPKKAQELRCVRTDNRKAFNTGQTHGKCVAGERKVTYGMEDVNAQRNKGPLIFPCKERGLRCNDGSAGIDRDRTRCLGS